MARGGPSTYCSFLGCERNSYTEGVHMFRFPKDDSRCQAWVDACKNPKLTGVPAVKLNTSSRVCNIHFEDWCFMNAASRNRLVHNAVPNSPKPRHFQQDMHASTSCDKSAAASTSTDIADGSCTSLLSASSFLRSMPSAPLGCSTPVSSKKYTPRKVKLARNLKRQRDSARKLKARFATYKKSVAMAKKQSLKQNLLEQGVSEKLSNFISRQVNLSKQKNKGKRYTQLDKIQAYKIFCKSRSAYRLLREFMHLPSQTTLQRFIAESLSEAGINGDTLKALKDVLQGKEKKARLFALVIDEMSIKPCLVHEKSSDSVIGFEDFGNNVKSANVANQALVLMLRSLTSKKKLPLGFFFSKHAMPAEKLKEIILVTLQALHDIEVVVKVLICDQASNNSRLFTLLGISQSHPFFVMNGHNIYGIFDPPHLLKSLRKNLITYDLESSKGLISFRHIKEFYEFDKPLLLRTARKLTDAHMEAKGLNSMKVKLAAQVFSNTVSAAMNLCLMGGMINHLAGPTVEFVKTVNDLFDSTNGTLSKPLRGKELHCAVSSETKHLQFWEETIQFISSWKFVKPGETKEQYRPRCRAGWTLTLNSLILVAREMLQEMQYFMPGRCNQDCLENFFSRVRGSGGNRTNPTAYEFRSAYKLAAVNFCSSTKFTNCEPDNDKFMFHLLSSGSQLVVEEKNVEQPKILPDSDDEVMNASSIDALNFAEANVCAYIAGYIARRVLAQVKCGICENVLTDKKKQLTNYVMYTYFKEYNPNTGYGLNYPTEDFVKYMAAAMSIATTALATSVALPKVICNLKVLMAQTNLLNFINCESHTELVKDKIVSFAAKLALKMHLRELNRKIPSTTCNLKNLRTSAKRKL